MPLTSMKIPKEVKGKFSLVDNWHEFSASVKFTSEDGKTQQSKAHYLFQTLLLSKYSVHEWRKFASKFIEDNPVNKEGEDSCEDHGQKSSSRFGGDLGAPDKDKDDDDDMPDGSPLDSLTA